jgi:hypothetical protein
VYQAASQQVLWSEGNLPSHDTQRCRMLSMQATKVHLAGSAMHQQRFGFSNVGSTQAAILEQHTRRSDSPCSDISAQQNRSHTAAAICSMAASPYSSAANCSSATKNHTHFESTQEICNTQASNNSLVKCTARAFKLTRMLSITATQCHAGAPLQLSCCPLAPMRRPPLAPMRRAPMRRAPMRCAPLAPMRRAAVTKGTHTSPPNYPSNTDDSKTRRQRQPSTPGHRLASSTAAKDAQNSAPPPAHTPQRSDGQNPAATSTGYSSKVSQQQRLGLAASRCTRHAYYYNNISMR